MPDILVYPYARAPLSGYVCSCCRLCLVRGHVPCRSDYFRQDNLNQFSGTRRCRLQAIRDGSPDQTPSGADVDGDFDDFDGLSHSLHDAYALGYDMIHESLGIISRHGRQQIVRALIRNLLNGANSAERHSGWRPRRMRLRNSTPPLQAAWSTPALSFPLENRYTIQTLPQVDLRPTSLDALF